MNIIGFFILLVVLLEFVAFFYCVGKLFMQLVEDIKRDWQII